LVNKGTLTNNIGGTLENHAGGAELINDNILTNNGELINKELLRNNGTLTNNAGGTLTNDHQLINNGRLINKGELVINELSSLDNNGTLENFGTLKNAGKLTIEAGGTLNNSGILLSRYGDLTNNGRLNHSGGTLITYGLVNNGEFNYSGGELKANITNNGNFYITPGGSNLTVIGDIFNWGTVKVTGPGSVHFADVILGNALINDPADLFFNNLTIDPNGYLKVIGDGAKFFISGDFLNYSTNPLWDTKDADLFFTGAGTHDFHLSNLAIANTWDMLSLLNGAILNLSGGAGSKLYVDEIVGGTNNIFNIGSNPITIYYDGEEFTLPGQPVPEPATMLLLGSGLIGLLGYGRKKFFKK